MYIICQVFGSVTALGFISPMVLAPLGSLSLIFNIIFSSFFLGTKITKVNIVGTILIVVGCVVVSISGINEPPTKSIDDLIRILSRPAFITYVAIQIAIVIFLVSMIQFLLFALKRMARAVTARMQSIRESTRFSQMSRGSESQFVSPRNSQSFSRADIPRNSHSAGHGPPSRQASQTPLSVDVEITKHTSHSDPVPRHPYHPTDVFPRHPSHPSDIITRHVSQTHISDAFPRHASQTHISDPSLKTSLNAITFSDLVESPVDERTPLIPTTATSHGKITNFIGLIYASVGGIVAAQTLLLTKSGVEVLVLSITEPLDGFHSFVASLILFLILVTAVVQVFFLTNSGKLINNCSYLH